VSFKAHSQMESKNAENHQMGIIIPHDRLSQTALLGLIEEFVTRDGTDTGYMVGSLEESSEMVIRQLKRGDVFIVYDEANETANIVPKDYAKSNLT
jgi:uncharacterized protein YheU (UPF0270 family)